MDRGRPTCPQEAATDGPGACREVGVGVSASWSPCASERPRRALRGTHGFAAAARTLRGQGQEQVRKAQAGEVWVPEEWEGLARSERTCGARGPRRRQRQRHCFFPGASAALQNASQPEPSPRTCCPACSGTLIPDSGPRRTSDSRQEQRASPLLLPAADSSPRPVLPLATSHPGKSGPDRAGRSQAVFLSDRRSSHH